jgi:hypothetical protein
MMPTTRETLTFAGLLWLKDRYGFKRLFVEAPPYRCDCLGISDRLAVEIEIKRDVGDFRTEIKKKKHHIYRKNTTIGRTWTPNLFYFLCPERIFTQIEHLTTGPFSRYGILVTDADFNIKIVRNAELLHPWDPSGVWLEELSGAELQFTRRRIHEQLS